MDSSLHNEMFSGVKSTSKGVYRHGDISCPIDDNDDRRHRHHHQWIRLRTRFLPPLKENSSNRLMAVLGSQETAQNGSKLEVAAVICKMMKATWLN